MRRIKITPDLIKTVNDFYSDLFLNNSDFIIINSNLETLINKYSYIRQTDKKKYLELLKMNLIDIAKADPIKIEEWKGKFDKIIHHDNISKEFHEEIVLNLNYKKLRSLPILPLYRDLKINSCVYCNAQLNVVLDVSFFVNLPKKGQVKERKATFELDHFWAKSKFPFLAISYFNLIPCCSSCNKSKLTSDALFYLYTSTDELDLFEFKFKNKSILKYWRSKLKSDIEIEFSSLTLDETILKNHKEIFKIDELYNTQLDLAEELIHKRFTYNKAYKIYLEKDYRGKLFADQAMVNRIIIGNNEKPEDIHKRPLAKFTQDLAKQLGLI